MGTVQALKMPTPKQTRHFHEFVWLPEESEMTDLRWTMFPEEAGARGDDFEPEPMPDLDRSITFRMEYDLFDKIQCLSSTMQMSTSELIRRLLQFEVHQYGKFEKIAKKSG
jgi:hypothetical protein